MAELTATATCSGFRATVEATGEVVGGRLLTARCGWLTALVAEMAARVVAGHWSAGDLGLLASGRSVDGRVLPVKGWMALRRLGWTAAPPAGVQVSDRVRRVVEEQAARMLRAAVYRRSVIAAIVGCWPADPGRRTEAEWQALRVALPAGVTVAEVGNRTRQIRAHLRAHGVLPGDLVEVEGPPVPAAVVLLAAADRQLVTLDRIAGTQAVLRVQLPLTPAPVGRRDWAVHTIPVTLPPAVPAGRGWARRRCGSSATGSVSTCHSPSPSRPPPRSGIGSRSGWTGGSTPYSPRPSAASTVGGWPPTGGCCATTPARSRRNCTGYAATAKPSPPNASTTCAWPGRTARQPPAAT
jgi:hypothetical protein